MSKILIVDDEQRYRNELETAIARGQHDVKTAATGRDAIDVGARFRPDVLIADWLLKNHIHGLHVSEVLHIVDPKLRTILITGFASQDLRIEAEKLGVFDFIEKPFDVDRIESAVGNAVLKDRRPDDRLPIGVVEVNGAGSIMFANWRAKEFFGESPVWPAASRLDALFGHEIFDELNRATGQWCTVSLRSSLPFALSVRSRKWKDEGGWLLALVGPGEEYYKSHPVVKMLLDLHDAAKPRWPSEGNVLVVDDFELIRRILVDGLQRAGCICHSAENCDVALRLFEKDDATNVVLLDYEIPGSDIGRFVRQIRRIRPDVTIVGCSGGHRRRDFAELGVDHFLPKPFVIDDLINMVAGRIDNCHICCAGLPLRRPRQGETAGWWVCRACGARYHAVLVENSPQELQANVWIDDSKYL